MRRHAYTFDAHWTSIALEWLTASAVLAAIVTPRGALAHMAIWLAVAGLLLLARPARSASEPSLIDLKPLKADGFSPVWVCLAVIGAFALASATWSPDVWGSLIKAVHVAVVLICTALMAACFTFHTNEAQWHACRGMTHALAVGMSYIAIEHATGGAIKAAVTNAVPLVDPAVAYNRTEDGVVIGAHPVFLNRHTVMLSLLTAPCIAAAWVWWPKRAATVGAALALAAAGLVAVSYSESAKLGFALAGVMFVIAIASPVLARWCWLGALLATIVAVPIAASHLPRQAELPRSWPKPVSERLAIWKATADRIPDAVMLGHGIESARVKTARGHARQHQIDLGRHAHNGFLQIWFEFGLAGAALMGALGVALVARIRTSMIKPQRAMLCGLAVATGVFAAGYGVWQIWLLSGYALMAILLGLLSAAYDRTRDIRP